MTSAMTPAHTLALRTKLATCFDTIGSQVDALDQVFLSENQKQRIHAAARLIKTARGFLARQRYRRARTALRSWRSRELTQAHALVRVRVRVRV